MPDAQAVQAHRVDRIAAAEEVMPCIQAKTEQVRVHAVQKALYLVRRLDERPSVMMENCTQSQFATCFRDPRKNLPRGIPLGISHAVARFVNTAGDSHP